MSKQQLSLNINLDSDSTGVGYTSSFFSKIKSLINSFSLVPFLIPITLALLWVSASHFLWVPPQILPKPSIVFTTLGEMFADGTIFEHTLISFSRVVFGVAIGGAIGLLLGFSMGLSRHLNDIIGPTFRALALVPKLGWIPLLILLVGLDEALKITSIAIGSAVPVALNTLQSIRNIPKRYLETAHVLGITGVKYFQKVILPSALPGVITGFVLAFSFGWKALIAVELMASSEGLGFLMVWGRQLFQMDIVLAAVIVIGVIGFILDKILLAISARLLGWLK